MLRFLGSQRVGHDRVTELIEMYLVYNVVLVYDVHKRESVHGYIYTCIYQFSSVTQLCLTRQSHGLHHARLPYPSPTPSLLKLMSTELVMPFNHPILCHPIFLPPSIFPSIRVFSNDSILCVRWSKYWGFSFSISPSNE